MIVNGGSRLCIAIDAFGPPFACRVSLACWNWTWARTWQNLINDGSFRLRRCQLEVIQKCLEATSPGCPPTLQLLENAPERVGRQVNTQRFQDAGQNRLPAGTVACLVGAARLPGLRRTAQRSFRFVV